MFLIGRDDMIEEERAMPERYPSSTIPSAISCSLFSLLQYGFPSTKSAYSYSVTSLGAMEKLSALTVIGLSLTAG